MPRAVSMATQEAQYMCVGIDFFAQTLGPQNPKEILDVIWLTFTEE